MSFTLSVDPGLCGAGVALWNDERLMRAAYVTSFASDEVAPEKVVERVRDMACAIHYWVRPCDVGQLVLEWPQTYSGRAARGDANDLFPLAGVDAALASLLIYAQVKQYTPHEWKGSIQKPKSTSVEYIVRERVIDRLDVMERAKVNWPGNKRHGWDVADAVGIGLKFLGRWRR